MPRQRQFRPLQELLLLQRLPPLRKQFLRRLNNLVTEDLRGSDWRHVPSQDLESLEELISEEAGHAEVEARLTLDALVSKAELSKAEAEIVTALRRDFNLTEAAEMLGIKAEAARVRWHRAKKKLRANTM